MDDNAAAGTYRGFLVHAWGDRERERFYITGRLEDGRSFAFAAPAENPHFHIYERDLSRARGVLAHITFTAAAPELAPFEGTEKLSRLEFADLRGRAAALSLLENAEIKSPDGGEKPHLAWLAARGVRGPVEIRGTPRAGRRVDLVFAGAAMQAAAGPVKAPLRLASIDIENDTKTGVIRTVSASAAESDPVTNHFTELKTVTRIFLPAGGGAVNFNALSGRDGLRRQSFYRHESEAAMLRGFVEDLRRLDPDVLTGWNFLDFDFPRLADRAEKCGVPFTLGRSGEAAKFFPGDSSISGPSSSGGDGGETWGRRRSAAALVPGRQVIDALRIVRQGVWGGGLGEFSPFKDFTLESAARAVLGEGKSVAATGDEKIAELDRLYAEEPETLARYCAGDAELVLRILDRTGLFRLTLERATATGVFLDKAWTSVAAFERIYGMELARRNTAPPVPEAAAVSGAAGGTILESESGLFRNVAVFDFRSLYPTIIRTFNIDPLSHARAVNARAKKTPGRNAVTCNVPDNGTAAPNHAGGGTENSAVTGNMAGSGNAARNVTDNAIADGGADRDSAWRAGSITAPNGAEFAREPGILPALIAEYFSARREALENGDATAASVYKILMNSFYGVLGTPACRYGRTELAGAITSFAKKWLHFSRDWFRGRNLRVLYGDTDSLFVETALEDGASFREFRDYCQTLADRLNAHLAETIRAGYGLESFLELRFEKACRRLIIPPLRNAQGGELRGPARGRAKGYGIFALREDGGLSTEVKGMEAVRSDTTPLARRLQVELLDMVFRDCGAGAFTAKVRETIRRLRAGEYDSELVYRRRLSRPPEAYTAATPPWVKAARMLGWKGRRGTVEYLWTVNGPEPLPLLKSAPDYDHYTDSQILPLARSIAGAAGWTDELYPEKGRRRDAEESGQMELLWQA